jgi:hypothetical protein
MFRSTEMRLTRFLRESGIEKCRGLDSGSRRLSPALAAMTTDLRFHKPIQTALGR